jgi:AcrR family transcriptional regulator
MNPQKVDSDTRKKQILAAATTVFARKGFDGTTMDDIMQASGLSKGGLYWHFKSKDDIIAAILVQFFSQELEGLKTLIGLEIPTGERLQLLGEVMAADMAQMAELASLSLHFYALAARDDRMRQFLLDYFHQYRALLVALIQEGFDSGEFASDLIRAGVITADAIALSLIAQLEGIALLWYVDPQSFDIRVQSEMAVRLLLQGLLKK